MIQTFIRVSIAMHLLFAASLLAQQPQQHPNAAKALEEVVQKAEFSGFTLDKHEVVTMRKNERVPGLNGLMFTYYKNADGDRVMLTVQWFEEEDKLAAFFRSQLDHLKQQQDSIPDKMGGLKKVKIAGSEVWSIEDKIYTWTDARHFVVGMSGKEIPPEMFNAYLKRIPSKIGNIDTEQKENATEKAED